MQIEEAGEAVLAARGKKISRISEGERGRRVKRGRTSRELLSSNETTRPLHEWPPRKAANGKKNTTQKQHSISKTLLMLFVRSDVRR